MNLRHLRYFVALAERLNFTAAARHLGIAQPPLSVQIRNLETEMGGALFHRAQRKIRLTPLGLLLLDEARDLLQQADRVSGRLRDAAEGRAGELRLGYTHGARSERVTRRLRKFLRRSRGIRLAPVPVPYAMDPASLPSNLDVVITETLPPNSENAIVLERSAIEIALPPKHRLAGRSQIEILDLLGETLLMASAGHRSPPEQYITELVDRKGLSVKVDGAIPDFGDRLWKVSLGCGVAVCRQADRDALDAVRVPLAGTPEVLTVCRVNAASRAVALPAFLAAIQE